MPRLLTSTVDGLAQHYTIGSRDKLVIYRFVRESHHTMLLGCNSGKEIPCDGGETCWSQVKLTPQLHHHCLLTPPSLGNSQSKSYSYALIPIFYVTFSLHTIIYHCNFSHLLFDLLPVQLFYYSIPNNHNHGYHQKDFVLLLNLNIRTFR